MRTSNNESSSGLLNDLRRLGISLSSLFRDPDNDSTYRLKDAVVDGYAHGYLQPPEREVINLLGSWLEEKSMLDVGVGTGRSTLYFAPLVGSYLGTDYSEPMIRECQRQRSTFSGNVDFEVVDVRDLSRFESESFDFVLFSGNGLDTMGHNDRRLALSELHRVCRPGGYLCLSTHNLSSVEDLYHLSDEQRSSAYSRLRGSFQKMLLRHHNPALKEIASAKHAILRDGALEFRLRHYYVRPSEQLLQLHNAGFTNVRVLGLDGRLIAPSGIDQAHDSWLHYLALAPE
jgi:ubiquinone/menaquinone biosynthesis C-methylase UbiE